MKVEGGNVWFTGDEPTDDYMTWYEAVVIYGGLLAIAICSLGLLGILVGFIYGKFF